jgi:oligopeptide transport system substrate-binding protein
VFYYPTNDSLAGERRVRAGELDLNTEIDGTRLNFLRRTLPGYVRVHDYMGYIFISFNTKKAPFDDSRVRRALSMAIDRDFIAKEILRAGQTPAYAVVPPSVANYPGGPPPDWASAAMPERRVMAKTLLEQAGFGPSNPLRFTYSHRNTGDNPRIAPVLQKNWADIAPWVRVQIQGVETQLHYQNMRTGDYDVADGGWIADFNDAKNFLFLMETKSRDQNYSKYSNPEFDALVARSDAERDPAKRGALLAAAQEVAARDQPMAPVVYYVNKNLVRSDIAGWVDNIEDIHRTRYLCRKKGAAAPAG